MDKLQWQLYWAENKKTILVMIPIFVFVAFACFYVIKDSAQGTPITSVAIATLSEPINANDPASRLRVTFQNCEGHTFSVISHREQAPNINDVISFSGTQLKLAKRTRVEDFTVLGKSAEKLRTLCVQNTASESQ